MHIQTQTHIQANTYARLHAVHCNNHGSLCVWASIEYLEKSKTLNQVIIQARRVQRCVDLAGFRYRARDSQLKLFDFVLTHYKHTRTQTGTHICR